MASLPQYRLLLREFSSSLREHTAKMAQDEDIVRRSILHATSRNGYAPSPSFESRLINVEKDQEALRAALTSLKAQQAILERLKGYAHNAKQSVCRIPDEILSSILETSIPISYDLWAIDPTGPARRRWTNAEYTSTLRSFGATCSRIRSVVLNSPRCWTLVCCDVARRAADIEDPELNLDGNAEAVMLSILDGIEPPLLSLTMSDFSGPAHKLLGNFSSIQAHSLTRLWIAANCSEAKVLQLLRRCTNLEHLFWKCSVVDEEEEEEGSETPPFRLSLDHLISLHVVSQGLGDDQRIFLTAPRLEQLDLTSASDHLPIDVLHPDHPPFPSLTHIALLLPDRHAERLAPFLNSHVGIREFYMFAELRPNDLPKLCAAIESFMAPPHADSASDSIHKPSLQHLSLEIPWEDFQGEEDALTISLELVLHMLVGLHIDLHLKMPQDTPGPPKVSEGHFKDRVSVNPPHERIDLWRNAWGRTSL